MEAEESDERKEKAPLEDLVIVKCNLELQTHSDTELLHFVCSYGMTLIFKESACFHIHYVDAVSCLHIVYVDAVSCLHIVQVICYLVIT